MKTCISVLPNDMLEEHLEDIVHAVFNERNDPMNKFRKKVRYMTIALLRKFGQAKMQELVPPEHHRLLSHIRKEANRKRTKSQRTKTINSRLTSFSLKSGFTDATTMAGSRGRPARSVKSKFYATSVWQDSDFSEDDIGYGTTEGGLRLLKAENRVRIRDDGDNIVDLMDPSAADKMVVETDEPTVRFSSTRSSKSVKSFLGEDEAEIDDMGNIVFGIDQYDKPKRRFKKKGARDGSDDDSDLESRPAKRRRVSKRFKKKQKGGGGGDDEGSFVVHMVKPGLLSRKAKVKKRESFKNMMLAPRLRPKVARSLKSVQTGWNKTKRGKKRKR